MKIIETLDNDYMYVLQGLFCDIDLGIQFYLYLLSVQVDPSNALVQVHVQSAGLTTPRL